MFTSTSILLNLFTTLATALKKTGKVGVATSVMRSKEGLAILRPSQEVIVLNRIRFAEEVRDYSELHLPEKADIKKGELDMAISLVNQLSNKFDISGYKDTYTEQLMALIEAKAKGQKITKPKMTG